MPSLVPRLTANECKHVSKGYMEASHTELCCRPSKPHNGVSPVVFLGVSSHFLGFEAVSSLVFLPARADTNECVPVRGVVEILIVRNAVGHAYF